MNAFVSKLSSIDKDTCSRLELKTLQVNMGNLCNQQCKHCHVDAAPDGKNIMSKETVDDILIFLSKGENLVLDITGGAPEMNPHFEYFVHSARPMVKEIIVRTNLTVFFELGKEHLPSFFKQNQVHLIGSLPCYSQENVDRQRGTGVFEKSINALKILNNQGYGKDPKLVIDLVHNSGGAFLPAPQESLEKDYKRFLKSKQDIKFNRLITITNAPINRFKDELEALNKYDDYMDLLEDSFNEGVVGGIMCRTLLSVGFDGTVYDCDFNQSLGMALHDEKGENINIRSLGPDDLTLKAIIFDDHCFSCTAGSGSSCQGTLQDNNSIEPEGKTRDLVRQYYGKVLSTAGDLKTNACCALEDIPPYIKKIEAFIEREIIEKFYGCGSPIPNVLEGCSLLDLGCGTGKDVYLASYLVGEEGRVIGVDMTDQQLEVARKYIDPQTRKFGFLKPNVELKKGYIEDLKEIPIEDDSMDVVISNCVINLSPDKKAVFKEIFRVLKPGGELYFSDVFARRRIPEHLKEDPVLYGECLGGALYIEDFRRMLREIGCLDYRVVSKRRITLDNAELEAKAGMIDFYSMTVRAFKLDGLEDICEDYGQVAIYLGTISESPHEFLLDDHHIFIKDKPMLVCGNTASMLQETRYARHFRIIGNKDIHYGLFDCKPEAKAKQEDTSIGGSCC